jgi:Sulfotransferase domain
VKSTASIPASVPVPALAESPHPAPRPGIELELAKLASEPAAWRGRPKPFFIAAFPRSGTNWLGALMGLHPRVVCTGEFTFHAMLNALETFTTAPGRLARQEPMRTQALRSFQRFVRDMMSGLEELRPGATHVGDHTPRPLRVFLPEAAYIVIVRDGRDIVVSLTYSVLARRAEWAVPFALRGVFDRAWDQFHTSQGDARTNQRLAGEGLLAHEGWVRRVARQWADRVRDDLLGVSMIDRGALPGSVRVVRYEDLHAGTTRARDELLGFLGLDPAQAQPISEATRTTPGFTREDPTSHFRIGRVGDWREKLGASARAWVEQEAGTELAQMGY